MNAAKRHQGNKRAVAKRPRVASEIGYRKSAQMLFPSSHPLLCWTGAEYCWKKFIISLNSKKSLGYSGWNYSKLFSNICLCHLSFAKTRYTFVSFPLLYWRYGSISSAQQQLFQGCEVINNALMYEKLHFSEANPHITLTPNKSYQQNFERDLTDFSIKLYRIFLELRDSLPVSGCC